MTALRAFYRALGWRERPGSNDDFATYVTLGVNVESVQEVDEAFAAALAAGAKPAATPMTREWGGYSGYVADPEGNRWEITWAPGP